LVWLIIAHASLADISQLGTRYATTISGWLLFVLLRQLLAQNPNLTFLSSSTHLTSKNFYLRGDDWLIVSRWEQLMATRDTLTFVELVTWCET